MSTLPRPFRLRAHVWLPALAAGIPVALACTLSLIQALGGTPASVGTLGQGLLTGAALALVLHVALRRLSERHAADDEAINAAYSEIQEQLYAFDEHAAVCVVDLRGTIVHANELLCALAGYDRHELIGQPVRVLDAKGAGEATQALWDTVIGGRVWHGLMRQAAKDGRSYWVETTAVPIRDVVGFIKRFMLIQTDVTAHQRLQEDLAANHRALEMITGRLDQLVRERTAALERANEELVRLNQVKSDFVSIVSHELRTPLTSIKAFTELLCEEVADPEAQRYLQVINDESDRLSRLIDDVLDLQKIDAGKMTWHDAPVNLADLVRGAVEAFSGAFRSKGLALEVDIEALPFSACVDSDRIRQVVANLLSNALKFTPEGSVRVRLCESAEAGFAQISVADTGTGLTRQQVEKIFEPFYQVADNQQREVKGTGLGLAICRQIVAHYGGRIWAESAMGVGTTFHFTLPLMTAEATATAPALALVAAGH